MLSINNQATSDRYSAALSLESMRGGGRVTYLVANASVFVQLRPFWDDASVSAEYGPEVLITPSTGGFQRASGIRFRSAIAGTPARVICQMYEPGDVIGDPGTAFNDTLTAGGGTVVSGVLPAGSILQFGGPVAPTGFVICDGAAYDGTSGTYSALFAAIGTTYGGVPAAFNVPDLRGRVPVGLGTNADVNALAASDALAVANRSPVHNHTNTLTLPNHAHSHTLTLPNHQHNVAFRDSGSGANFALLDGQSASNVNQLTTNPTTNPAINGSIGNPTTNPAINGGVGPGGSRPNDEPAFLVVNHIISLG